jgi:hypothetical protein
MRTERRRQSIQSLIHGARYPRRRNNRRPEDDQLFVPDSFDASLVFLGLAIIMMSMMDSFFTLNIIALGGQELNAFMNVLLENSTQAFLVVKYCITASGVVLLIALSKVRVGGFLLTRRLLEGLCCGYGCLMIYEVYLLVTHASTVVA